VAWVNFPDETGAGYLQKNENDTAKGENHMPSPTAIYIKCAVGRIHGVAATRLAASAVSCQSIASYHTADCRVEDCWYATFYSVDIGMGRSSRCCFNGGHWLEIATRNERAWAAMSVRYARNSDFGRCSKSLIEVFFDEGVSG
jgi:hypothetical protein